MVKLGLAALLFAVSTAVSGCEEEEQSNFVAAEQGALEDPSESDKIELQGIVEASIEPDETELQGVVEASIEPVETEPDYDEISHSDLKKAIEGLSSREAQAYTMSRLFPHPMIKRWEELPVSEEDILETIEFYKSNDRIFSAINLARGVSYSEGYEKYSDIAKKICSDAANNPSFSNSKRASFYKELLRFTKWHSQEWEEAIENSFKFYMQAGNRYEARRVAENLGISSIRRLADGTEKTNLPSPGQLKRRDELLQLVEDSRVDECTTLKEQISYDNHRGMEDVLLDIKENSIRCDTDLLLKAYELLGMFGEAKKLAEERGLHDKIQMYEILSSEELDINQELKRFMYGGCSHLC